MSAILRHNLILACILLSLMGLAARPASAQSLLNLQSGDNVIVSGSGTTGIYQGQAINNSVTTYSTNTTLITVDLSAGSTFTLQKGGTLSNTSDSGTALDTNFSATTNITGGIISGGTGFLGNGIGNEGITNISGGTISGGDGGIFNSGTLTISGGSIAGLSSDAGSVTVSGGTITGKDVGLYVYSGSVTVSGGTIIGNSTSSIYGTPTNLTVAGGTLPSGLYLVNGTTVITGGTISSGIAEVAENQTTSSPASVYIAGGKISGRLVASNGGSAPNGSTIDLFGSFTATDDNGNPISSPITNTDGMIAGTLLNGQAIRVPYSAFGGTIEFNVGVPPPSVSIDLVKMSDAHTLEVDITGLFSSDKSTIKTFQLSTQLNGKTLNSQIDSNLQYTVDTGIEGTVYHNFFVDLKKDNVNRFTSNQEFSVTVIGSENSLQVSETKMAAILLPTILVPGIDPLHLHSQGGDGSFPSLELFLQQESTANLSSKRILGEGYSLVGDLTSYPTLYTLSYDRNYASLIQGATDLSVFCQKIRQATYADSVNIAAHSKGGLVARQYLISGNLAMNVNSFVMCYTPNVGSLWALKDSLGVGDYSNLYPLWAWLQIGKNITKPYFISTPNLELTALNQTKLPSNVNVTNIWSNSIDTRYTENNTLLPLYTFTDGDFVVPAFSQLGLLPNTNSPNSTPQLIPAFRSSNGDEAPNIENVPIPGRHFTLPTVDLGGFDIPAVQQEILSKTMIGIQ